MEAGSAQFKAWVVGKLEGGGRTDYVLKVRLGKDAGKFEVGRTCKFSKVVSPNKSTKTYNAERKEVKAGGSKVWKGCTEFHVGRQPSRFWNAEDERTSKRSGADFRDAEAVSDLNWD